MNQYKGDKIVATMRQYKKELIAEIVKIERSYITQLYLYKKEFLFAFI